LYLNIQNIIKNYELAPAKRRPDKRNKSDQAISLRAHDGERERAPDPGLKHQASTKLVNACIDQGEPQAPSTKPQAPGFKHK
jgi:hypothetical protein